jgi:hypothetical protein
VKAISVVLVIALEVAYAPMAAGQSSGTFAATGNMITPRFFHTATCFRTAEYSLQEATARTGRVRALKPTRNSTIRLQGDFRRRAV